MKKNIFWNKCKSKANKIYSDNNKLSELIKSFVVKLKTKKSILKDLKEDINISINLLQDWMTGNYKNIPKKTIIRIVAAYIYFINPFDLIPDFIIKFGFLDDLSVLSYVLYSIKEDLNNYKIFKLMGNNNNDKYLGCLFGLAIGDAFGAPFEFKEPNHIKELKYQEGGVHQVSRGEWTDDTSMSLCIIDSLIRNKNFIPEDIMFNFIEWKNEGKFSSRDYCFDIGVTVQRALHIFSNTKNPYSGLAEPSDSGNGGIMRLAPIPVFFSNSFDDTIKYSILSSKLTHSSEMAVDTSIILGYILYKIFNSKFENKNDLVSSFSEIESLINSIEGKRILRKEYLKLDYLDLKPTGFCIDTLNMALWCFYNSNSFEEGLLKSVGLGGDSDTIGAVYGQIAGAYYGFMNIPEYLIYNIHNFDYLHSIYLDFLNKKKEFLNEKE